jgi:hypothetical protein
MIAAEEHRELSLVERCLGELRNFATHGRYGAEEACPALRTTFGIFTKRDCDVSAVLNLVANVLEPLAQVGISNGKGAHVDAPSRCAQVHRDAD